MRSNNSAANAAKALKAELKKEFPGVKFSVKSEVFAGGDSVNVSYNDGPTTKQVEEFANKYQMGTFNGMEDIYENSNINDDLPQAKFVMVQRSYSPETEEKIVKQLRTEIDSEFDPNSYYDGQIGWQLIRSKFNQIQF